MTGKYESTSLGSEAGYGILGAQIQRSDGEQKVAGNAGASIERAETFIALRNAMHDEAKRKLPSRDVSDPLDLKQHPLDATRTFCLSSSWDVVYHCTSRLAMQPSADRNLLERLCHVMQQNPGGCVVCWRIARPLQTVPHNTRTWAGQSTMMAPSPNVVVLPSWSAARNYG